MFGTFGTRRPVTIPSGHKECPSCGEIISKKENHETVIRIVRMGNHYGAASQGEQVEIEPRHLTKPIQQATMSLEEFEALKAANKPKPKKKGKLAEMVENYLEYSKAEVKASIARGKQHLQWQRDKAIAEGKDLPKGASALDQEPETAKATHVKE